MDSWARVDVPYAQWIMVSITMDILSTVNCVKERIALYKGNATSIGGEIFTVCDFKTVSYTHLTLPTRLSV